MFITITAGHSNTDPGAVNGSDREADIAQDMRNIVASILRTDYGLEVKTDGEGKGNMPLREAVKLIKGSRLAVEFHTNAAAKKEATGIEALSIPKNKGGLPAYMRGGGRCQRLEATRRRRLQARQRRAAQPFGLCAGGRHYLGAVFYQLRC